MARPLHFSEVTWFQRWMRGHSVGKYAWIELEIQEQLRHNNPALWQLLQDPSISEDGHATVLLGLPESLLRRELYD